MGRSCQADLQLPGGGEPPPYGCVARAGYVGTELTIKSQLPGGVMTPPYGCTAVAVP